MDLDWVRFGGAVRDARRSAGMSQLDLAEAAGVGRSAVQGIERGRSYDAPQLSHRVVAAALGWAPTSVESVLGGGDPSRVRAPSRPGTTTAPRSEADEFLDDLTERVKLALLGGTVVDSDVVELGDEDGDEPSEVVMIWKRGERPDMTPAQRRAQARKWAKLQAAAREIFAEDAQ
ncbi:transcriptional regulator with XRE-family HTH domain [Kitasatospora gansuensis]|uniref:Transcriptional regulator with XRE-family HTH domain n=1 Tax=Kitasatospora gansuensis TaxID=258050 RepID=A0A7W7WK59_9ACTN|nr:helix-turn-helix transcriptional regulator [Kitasatospora gansuensis]MBB4949680.1 transcriptional regulator with XRE-family HTH domain [Kitasatospora gansuensis]